MKLIMIFARKAPKRKPTHPAHRELITTWTTRDWADLPTHHPRRQD